MLLNEKAERPKRSRAFCVALGGVISALVLLLMFMNTVFPMLDYAIPTYAGFLMVVVISEAGSGWAFMTYAACAVLCMLMTPDYQANLLFILFMGYYPILYVYLQRLNSVRIRRLCKVLIFNAAIITYALVFKFLFTSVDLFEGMENFGKWAAPAMLAMANVFFMIYDRLLGSLIQLYTMWFRKKILTKK
ncbi:hypothetical protein SAMN02910447_01491 [Ruminococcus sp. YE71]|uniref:hypothetical protein n=1 Tax=unclassified Ruminococcus TaxID=2608920 RepID=UPI000886F008|nr:MULTISPECIES: hypothetical protein [unclassified Ruminococcus]SDA18681.1 hypothetical protein SAMN02910446_01483 [Ruminococcus sp. YE78]SFW29477.1 hypothetical protein SAMN02910447_01491 [Ruminococcus sp. YE71]